MRMHLQRWYQRTHLTKVVSKTEVLRSKLPTIALEEGTVECVGELGNIK